MRGTGGRLRSHHLPGDGRNRSSHAASEVAGRAGKQPDGSAKTREAKLVTLWTAESRDALGKPVRDAGSVTYSAAIESAAVPNASPTRSDFADRVLRGLPDEGLPKPHTA